METADLSEMELAPRPQAGQVVRMRAIISRAKAVYLGFLPWGK